MKKRIVFMLTICLLLALALSGCGREEAEAELPPVPEIPEDYIYLASENVYYTLGLPMDNSIFFPLISATPLKQPDFADVTFDVAGLQYMYRLDTIGASAAVPMSYSAYRLYRENLADAADASADNYLADYQQLSDAGRLPLLYNYHLCISIGETDCAALHEITLQVKGQTLTFPLSEIRSNPNAAAPTRGQGLSYVYGASCWDTFLPCADGTFRIDGSYPAFAEIPASKAFEGAVDDKFAIEQATEDVTITDIFLWEDTREISNIEILITQPDDPEAKVCVDESGAQTDAAVVAAYTWDGETPIPLKTGERIRVRFTLHEPRLAGKLTSYTKCIVALQYQTADGATYTQTLWHDIAVRTANYDPHEIYLAHELGIDVVATYTAADSGAE